MVLESTEVKRNIIRDKSSDVSVRIINLYKLLTNERKEYVLPHNYLGRQHQLVQT